MLLCGEPLKAHSTSLWTLWHIALWEFSSNQFIFMFLLSQEQTFLRCYNSSSISKAGPLHYISPLPMSLCFILSWAASLNAFIFIACIYTHNCHIPDWNASQCAYELRNYFRSQSGYSRECLPGKMWSSSVEWIECMFGLMALGEAEPLSMVKL